MIGACLGRVPVLEPETDPNALVILEMPTGFNRYENSKLGQEVLASMLEDGRQIGRSKLRISQKMRSRCLSFPESIIG